MKYFSSVTARVMLGFTLMSFLAFNPGCSGDASSDAGREMSTDKIVLAFDEAVAATGETPTITTPNPLYQPLTDLLVQIEAGASMVTQEPYHSYLTGLADSIRDIRDQDNVFNRLINLAGADADGDGSGDSTGMDQIAAYFESLSGLFSDMGDLGGFTEYATQIQDISGQLQDIFGQMESMEDASGELFDIQVILSIFTGYIPADIMTSLQDLINIMSGDISTDDLPTVLYDNIIVPLNTYADGLRQNPTGVIEVFPGYTVTNAQLADTIDEATAYLDSIGSMTATFAPPDAKLQSLTVSAGTLSPAFLPDVEEYKVEVANDIESITVTPTTSANNATVTVNGTQVPYATASQAIALEPGVETTITIVVTADNGTTTLNYWVRVTRLAGPSTNAYLADLKVSYGDIVPAPFDPLVGGYQVEVINEITVYTVTPTVAGVGATLTVNGSPVVSGAVSQQIDLVVGYNTIIIEVTAGDGATKKNYSVTVHRPEPL